MAKYNFQSINPPYVNHSTISSAFIVDLNALREAIQKIVQNTSNMDSPGMTSIKQFLCDVPIGAIQSLQLGMEEYKTVYEKLLKMASEQIDTSDMANISNEALTAIWDFSLVRADFIEAKTIEVNRLLNSLTDLDIFVTQLPTGDAGALHSSVFNTVQSIEEGMSNVDKDNSVDTLKTFFTNISKFVNFLGTCINTDSGKIQYDQSSLTSQQWYKDYAETAISIIAGYGDDYFINMNNSNVMTLVEQAALTNILDDIFDKQDAGRLTNLAYNANGEFDVDRLKAYRDMLLNEQKKILNSSAGNNERYSKLGFYASVLYSMYSQFERFSEGGQHIINSKMRLEFSDNGNIVEVTFDAGVLQPGHSQKTKMRTSTKSVYSEVGDVSASMLKIIGDEQIDKSKPTADSTAGLLVDMGLAIYNPLVGSVKELLDFAFAEGMSDDEKIDYIKTQTSVGAFDSLRIPVTITVEYAGNKAYVTYTYAPTDETENMLKAINALVNPQQMITFDDLSTHEGRKKVEAAYNLAKSNFHFRYPVEDIGNNKSEAFEAYLKKGGK